MVGRSILLKTLLERERRFDLWARDAEKPRRRGVIAFTACALVLGCAWCVVVVASFALVAVEVRAWLAAVAIAFISRKYLQHSACSSVARYSVSL